MILDVQAACQVAKSLIYKGITCGMILVQHIGMPLAWGGIDDLACRLHGHKSQAIKSPAMRRGDWLVYLASKKYITMGHNTMPVSIKRYTLLTP